MGHCRVTGLLNQGLCRVTGALDCAGCVQAVQVARHWTSGCGCTGLVCTGLCRAAGVLGGLVTGVVAAQRQGLMARF